MSYRGDTERLVLPDRSSASVTRVTTAPSRRRFDPADGSLADQPQPVERETPERHQSGGRRVARWLKAILIILLVSPPLLGASLIAAIYWQARSDQTQPVDAIVVLGTAQYNGRPSPVLRARLDRALEVYEAGTAPVIVVTGGRNPGDAFTEAEASRDYLVERGVPEGAMLMEDQGRDSWQSMQGVRALLEERDLSRVLLVSDGFHLFRLKLMARDLGLVPFGTAATESPIRQGGGVEFGYAVREAAGVLAHLWATRL